MLTQSCKLRDRKHHKALWRLSEPPGWLRDVLQGLDVVLREALALEYLQMFNGYLNETEIEELLG